MKKKILILGLIFIGLFTLTGCTNKDASKFKEDYESLNGVKTSYDNKNNRKVTIDKNNPYVFSTAEEILEKIENKETFYVYFGSKHCPWCRSVIESSIKVANENNIKEIYYVDIWEDFHEEILRDTYELDDDNKPVLKEEGTDEYKELLKALDNVLSDYTLTTEDGETVEVGEKRIYAPNFIYIKNGKAIKLAEGISEKQDKYNSKLTDEILKDQEKIFNDFFNN